MRILKLNLSVVAIFAFAIISNAQSVITQEKLINATFTSKGDLEIVPSKKSSSHDFDFFEGKWNVHNKKLKTRLREDTQWTEYDGTNEDMKMLGGIGHTNNNRSIIEGQPYEGVGLTLFNPHTKLWSIYWASSKNGILDKENPMVGSFEGDIGSFYAMDTHEGKSVIVLARWDKSDPDHTIWSQAFSADKGKTWEWNWYMYENRVIENDELLEKLLTFDTTIPIPAITFDTKGELVIKATPNSSSHDFDFLTGKWKMYHRKLRARLENSHEWDDLVSIDENYGSILNGIGNTDLYTATFDDQPFEGFTLRLFNPDTKLWSLYWVASNSGVLDPPVVGSFDGSIGHFFCTDTYKGKEVVVVFRWDRRDIHHPVWSQAFSPDKGKTWEWNWINASYEIE